MLFFPQRFFMYPIYQYDDVPLLLCAFDADYYRERRSSLKGIVDRYVPAIFSSILAFQLSETNKMFSAIETPDGEERPFVSTNEAVKSYVSILGLRMKHLLRLFCKEMAYAESLIMRKRNRDNQDCEEFAASSEVARVEDNRVLIRLYFMKKWEIYEMLNEDRPPGGTIIPSKNGRHLLKLYLEHYADIFSRSVKHTILVKEVERNKVSHAVAHAVKTGLSPLSALSKVFADRIDKLDTLLESIEHYKETESEMPFGLADLDTSEIPFDKLNSVGSVLSFYAEDAERKVGLLYGGVKKDQYSAKTEKGRVENYIIAGIARGYCISLIRSVDSLVENRQVKKITFVINGVEHILRVKEIEDTLEMSRKYQFDKEDGIVLSIKNLRLDHVGSAKFGFTLNNPAELSELKCKLLMIVVEELTLNAITNIISGDIRIDSAPKHLFRIENWAKTPIPGVQVLQDNIRTEVMGGLHTAYFVTVDRDYLRMSFKTGPNHNLGDLRGEPVLNWVEIDEDRHA